MGREERMLSLVRQYFSENDLLAIKSRLIGSGFIGGKAVGMLLARAILTHDSERPWEEILEPHDSFYVGSDVFNAYIEHNGWQQLFQEQRSEAGFISGGVHLHELFLKGEFPPAIRAEFLRMLDYYGQYPIIARSSSLQEDGFGNAFAGKYDSFFCVNQGPINDRLRQFEAAVRKIYASAMSDEALQYRLQRGLSRQEEHMAVLVQRVSGRRHGQYFLPAFAGVGVSYNTFVWNSTIDPAAGMLRLVVGLGTRAVDRIEGDYPRIVSLDKPMLLPYGDHEDLRRYTQRDIDLLDIDANALRTISLREFLGHENRLPMDLFAERNSNSWLVTFERLLTRTGFVATMQRLLATIEKAYEYPVDVEFTGNFKDDGSLKINVVQCRPLQTRGVKTRRVEISKRPEDETLFSSSGNFMGGSIALPISRVITVDPEEYTSLTLSDKYELARIIGRLNRMIPSREELPTLLMGPGRWGTTTPSLGVPVRFAEFNAMAALAEVAFSAGGLMPELSFGSHFFQDLVESGIFYVALYPEKKECFLNANLLLSLPNNLQELLPDDARFSRVLRVVDLPAGFWLLADIVSQEVSCCHTPEACLGSITQEEELPVLQEHEAEHGAENFVTTGIAGLDQVLGGLRLGDNVVWRVDDLEDYRGFVRPYVAAALAEGRRVVYIRFAAHPPVLEEPAAVKVYNLDAFRGFESFTVHLHAIISQEGERVFYVFDCLSGLLDAWATDAMIGNFFSVTCPHLFELETVAYFPLLRGVHPFATIARIRSTTQLLIDLHNRDEGIYLHPLKVWRRSSPTMFLPHLCRDHTFVPISASYEASNLFMKLFSSTPDVVAPYLDHWERLFLRASKLTRKGGAKARQAMVDEICRLLFGSDERMLNLARHYLTLDDMLLLKDRLIGTGYIGGKAAGLLVSRAILRAARNPAWDELLEPHDSFFIGSDQFHSYIVHNGWWRIYMEHKTPEGYFRGAAKLEKLLLQGSFPPDIREEFQKLLEYFGQYPIIVRLSSLQEDGFGNAFAGKYGSYFCVNQGSPEERYCQFEEAVRQAYASTMSDDVLQYRIHRGLDQSEEQMALLVQRVSGSFHGRYFFPDLAGVALSYNTFVWDATVDPNAGLLRMVFGLGTRATARIESDYPRLVALDRPVIVPFENRENGPRFSQKHIDVLDVEEDRLRTLPIPDLMDEGVIFSELLTVTGRFGKGGVDRFLSFDRILAEHHFHEEIRQMLSLLESAYGYPVDMEFTATFNSTGSLKINPIQCRPLQTKGIQVQSVVVPDHLPAESTFFRATGHFMGGSIVQPIRRIIMVTAQAYLDLPVTDKYEVARIIGRLNRLIAERDQMPTLLMVPGRLGTTTPEMGVPVRFAEINNMTALVEVAFTAGSLMPELSFGSHFFQDLVESGIFYAALYPEEQGCTLNEMLLNRMPSRLEELLPDNARFSQVVSVVDLDQEIWLLADIVSQQLACCRRDE
jgi:hypothetical protein